jgi:hypothetical protein
VHKHYTIYIYFIAIGFFSYNRIECEEQNHVAEDDPESRRWHVVPHSIADPEDGCRFSMLHTRWQILVFKLTVPTLYYIHTFAYSHDSQVDSTKTKTLKITPLNKCLNFEYTLTS